ncbi:MAG: TetR/AcrR family transcriptional regulator [Apilactobacillus sp.]|uniref:TetR/AcrR family transcriptional regulator n=1 Tax=Apilactobacillus sp. TaxID=2767901 RepID=UPI0025D5ECEA|nr:TetR/AcrR family transcriptional regulator [Apilactobacillus sp.]MCT6822695.1 TetR/AcrR family transcriptional regulator [Apilactobacillus sp.]
MYERKRQITKNKIMTAFMQLVQQKGLQTVRVTEIVNAAKISRGTFYQYYDDKYAIIEEQQKDLFQLIEEQHRLFIDQPEEELRKQLLDGKLVNLILDVLDDNDEIVEFLFKNVDGFMNSAGRFFEKINLKTLLKINPLVNVKRADIIAAVISTALIKLIELYISDDKTYSREIILKESRELIRVNVLTIV